MTEVTVTYNFKSSSLDEVYGDNPVGLWVFFRLRPATMQHGGMEIAHGDK